MLTLIVFLNGMAVMVLEMTGARLLAPELGTSIVVWTSLIGIVMAGLSAGYWLGGHMADNHMRGTETPPSSPVEGEPPSARRRNPRAVLSGLLFCAAVSVFCSALLAASLQGTLGSLVASLHLAAVLAAVLLFGLPAVLCGMVSPYAIRLGITNREKAGGVVGRLNAAGTVGSILGTFLGGFFLPGWFSSHTAMFGTAGVLLLASVLVRLRPVLPKAAFLLLLIAAATADIAGSRDMLKAGPSDGHPITIETAYSSISLVQGTLESRPALFLLTGPGTSQSGMYQDAPDELAFSYTRFYRLGTTLVPDAKNILMLGGGGYSVPKWLLAGSSGLSSSDFSLDVVEIDPGMTHVASSYFHTPVHDPRIRIHHEDGRVFLNKRCATPLRNGTYDLIFADTFNSSYSVPFHMGTSEAAANIKRLLSDDGVYIMNIISGINGENGRLLRSIRNAFLEHFEEVHLFPVQLPYDGTAVQNVMLLAFAGVRPLPDPTVDNIDPDTAKLLWHRWEAPFPPAANDVPPLRDAYAPVERYTLGFLD